MNSRRTNLFILLAVVLVLAGSAAVVALKPTTLGLDLQGGVEVIYRANPGVDENGKPVPITPDVMSKVVSQIRDRVDATGDSEPEIQTQNQNEVSVQLPGVDNADRVIALVGRGGLLEFFNFEPAVIASDPSPPDPSAGKNADFLEDPDPGSLYDLLKNNQDAKNKDRPEAPPRYYLFNKDTGDLLGQDGQPLPPPAEALAPPANTREELLQPFDGKLPPGAEVVKVPGGFEVAFSRQIDATKASGLEQVEFRDEQGNFVPTYYLLQQPPPDKQLTGADLKSPTAQAASDARGWEVNFRFSNKGKDLFKSLTGDVAKLGRLEGQNRTFAAVVDGRIVSNASVDYNEFPSGISGGTGARITGLAPQEARDLASLLAKGSLPVSLEQLSSSSVSATLGEESLRQAIIAMIAGFALVVLFLLAYYRFLGLVASLALGAFALVYFAVLKGLDTTFTLPGIAGAVLTIGVAADANIVIFERIKEEVRAGASVRAAIARGYPKGFRTIIDANVVTLITAFVLFALATAGVKGFALTLALGVIVSMFTAVLATRALLGLLSGFAFMNRPSFMGASNKPLRWKWNLMARWKLWFLISNIVIIPGVISLASQGLNAGIDFDPHTEIAGAFRPGVGEQDIIDSLGRGGVDTQAVQVQKTEVKGDTAEASRNQYQLEMPTLLGADLAKVRDQLVKDVGYDSATGETNSVGPTFGKQILRSAIYALLLSFFLISIYLTLRFEWKYALPALIAIVHDLLVTLGIYSIIQAEVTSASVAAVLTILGYSLYDTIIVFDRVRENTRLMTRSNFRDVVNRSLLETFTRSLNTMLTVIIPVLALYLFGGETLKTFALALIIGTLSGAFSSIFTAAPVLMLLKEREPQWRSRERRMARTPAVATAGAGPGRGRTGPQAASIPPAPLPAPAIPPNGGVDGGRGPDGDGQGRAGDGAGDGSTAGPNGAPPGSGGIPQRRTPARPPRRSRAERRRDRG